MTQIDPSYVRINRFEVIDPDSFSTVNSTLHELHTAAFEKGETVEQQQTPIHDGLGVKIGNAVLYHGSGAAGITEFLPAQDTTIGDGFYATSQPEAAALYAYVRARKSEEPHLYTVGINNVNFVDLRLPENVTRFLQGFVPVLHKEIRNINDGTSRVVPGMQDLWCMQLAEKIELIESGIVTRGNLKRVLQTLVNGLFTNYVLEQGYNGIVGLEGGEFAKRMSHDSWVIMEPSKATIKQVTQLPVFVVEREKTPEEELEVARSKEVRARFGKPIPPYTNFDQITSVR